jgi:hypothetical protein
MTESETKFLGAQIYQVVKLASIFQSLFLKNQI